MKNSGIISLGQLGLEYRPDIQLPAARMMMKGLIERTPGLPGALKTAGWDGRNVTPRIRQVFYDYLGEP